MNTRLRTTKRLGSLLLLCASLLAACSDSTDGLLEQPPNEERVSFTGIWTGRAEDNIGGADLILNLVQAGDQVTGDLTISERIGPFQITETGTVQRGNVDGNTITMRLVPDNPDYCSYDVKAVRQGDILRGNYHGVNCSEEIVSEYLRLEKQ